MLNSIFLALIFNLSLAHGTPDLMPRNWGYEQQGAYHLWRSPDHRTQAILVEYDRAASITTSVQDLNDHKFELMEARVKTLEAMGFRKIAYDYWKTSSNGKSIAVTEIRFRYQSPGGLWQASHEKLYSTSNKVRLTAITYPLEQTKVESSALLKRLAPKWLGRQVAAAENATEASLCCQLDPNAISDTPTLPMKDQPNCKGVALEDLQTPHEPRFDLASLYSDSKLATPIGCVQGVYELGTKVLSGVKSGLSGAAHYMIDSKYREEVAAAIGYGASAIWNDPVGVSQRVINSLIAEVAKNWNELACLNRRASARAVCEAVMGLIIGDKALKVLKLGLVEASNSIPGVAEVLKKSLTKKIVPEPINISPQAVTVEASSSPLAARVKSIDPNVLPFRSSLASNLEQASKIGGIDEELIYSRIDQLATSATRDKAYDDLRRIDYVITALLKEPGDNLSRKIDFFLQKQVTDPKQRDLLRSCLLKGK